MSTDCSNVKHICENVLKLGGGIYKISVRLQFLYRVNYV